MRGRTGSDGETHGRARRAACVGRRDLRTHVADFKVDVRSLRDKMAGMAERFQASSVPSGRARSSGGHPRGCIGELKDGVGELKVSVAGEHR